MVLILQPARSTHQVLKYVSDNVSSRAILTQDDCPFKTMSYDIEVCTLPWPAMPRGSSGFGNEVSKKLELKHFQISRTARLAQNMETSLLTMVHRTLSPPSSSSPALLYRKQKSRATPPGFIWDSSLLLAHLLCVS